MNRTTIPPRSGRRLAVLAVMIATVLASCVTPPTGGGPPPWLAAGCLNSSNDGPSPAPIGPDFYFNGTPGVLNNSTFYTSTDGSCSGPSILQATMVQAPDGTTAEAICTALGLPGAPFPIATGGWPVPSDAWGCPVPS